MPAALADLETDELARVIADWGFPPSHAERVLRRFYSGQPAADESHRLPAGLADRIAREFPPAAALAHRQTAADGTSKLLLRLGDGRTVESVLMPDYRPDRAAGCVSTQVGCAMG